MYFTYDFIPFTYRVSSKKLFYEVQLFILNYRPNLQYCKDSKTATAVVSLARNILRNLTGMAIDKNICPTPCNISQFKFDPLMVRFIHFIDSLSHHHQLL